jgi:hypothetical protein
MDGVKQQDRMPQNDSTLKTPAPLFFQNNLTFVIQMLINAFPQIVFVQTFFLHIN